MIDILPYNQKSILKRIRSMRVLTVMVWMTTILLIVAAALLFPTLLTVNSRYDIAIKQTQQLQESGAITKAVDILGLQQRTKRLKEKLAAPLPSTPLVYIEHIRMYEGSGIHLTGFTMNTTDTPVVEVNGVATTRQSLQRFVASLQADPSVANVDSPVTNFVKSSQSDFAITVTFKSS